MYVLMCSMLSANVYFVCICFVRKLWKMSLELGVTRLLWHLWLLLEETCPLRYIGCLKIFIFNQQGKSGKRAHNTNRSQSPALEINLVYRRGTHLELSAFPLFSLALSPDFPWHWATRVFSRVVSV